MNLSIITSFVDSIAPTVAPGLIGGLVALHVVRVNRKTALETHKEKLKFDKDITQMKFKFDKQLALDKFAYERQQVVFKQRFELAEQVLADAYFFREMMKFVRNGVVFADEGKSRIASENESEHIKDKRNNYFTPIERLKNENEFVSTMFMRKTTCQAHFGENVETAFSLFHTALIMTRQSAYSLIKYPDLNIETKEMLRWQRHISGVKNETTGKDVIAEEINQGVALIEEFCKPVLAWVDKPIS